MTRREQPPVLRKHAMFQTRATMVVLLAAMAFQANMTTPFPFLHPHQQRRSDW